LHYKNFIIKNIIIKYLLNKKRKERKIPVAESELISGFLELNGFSKAMVSARINDAHLYV